MKNKYSQGWKEIHMESGKAQWGWPDFIAIGLLMLVLIGSFVLSATR